ncbi:MAG TPA: HlyD family efflux transporter periplasmic adaptor subunit [Pseudomonadota bacterium]|nr:HlyD family efflux transporter periplasmic adaptor subunit [Pseudomonadota bacterium]
MRTGGNRAGLTALVALVALTALLGCSSQERAAAVPVIAVKQQLFSRIVEADGYLRPVLSVPVTVPSDVPGSLRIIWLQQNGAVVKKGEPVVRFDDLEPTARLQDAESSRAVSTANREKEAVAQRADSQQRQRDIVTAQRELELSRTFVHRDPLIFSRDQIIEDELDEKWQTAKLAHAQKIAPVGERLSRNKLGLTEVEVQKAAESIRRAQKGLNALVLTAPHDGVLTIRRRGWGDTWRVGDVVYRTMSVADVSPVDNMEVEVFVLEAEAAGLAKGRKAEVTIEAQPGRPLAATVKQVETVTKQRQEKSPTQYFGVILSLEHTDPEICKPGERARARLFLHEQQALVLPRPALVERDGRWVVYRRDARGAFAAVPVTLGPSTAGLVTIESGLRAGELVALRDPGKAAGELLSSSAQKPDRAN